MDHRDRVLSQTASDQHGLFTLQQAIASGLSERAVETRVARGTYSRMEAGVFSVGGSQRSWRQLVLSAVLSTNELAAASHRTAAYLWGMTSWRAEDIEVVAKRHERAIRRSFVVHESLDLISGDVVRIDGVPTTSAPRTVVDLGAVSPVWAVEACLDTGLRKDLFTLDEVQRFMNRVARRGRRGVGVVRPLLETRFGWQALTESDLEDLFRRGRGAERDSDAEFSTRCAR